MKILTKPFASQKAAILLGTGLIPRFGRISHTMLPAGLIFERIGRRRTSCFSKHMRLDVRNRWYLRLEVYHSRWVLHGCGRLCYAAYHAYSLIEHPLTIMIRIQPTNGWSVEEYEDLGRVVILHGCRMVWRMDPDRWEDNRGHVNVDPWKGSIGRRKVAVPFLQIRKVPLAFCYPRA